MRIENKIAWVTGSALRLGRAIALDLADRGADVVVHYQTSADAAREVIAEIEGRGRRALLVQGDLARPDEIERMAGEIEQGFGGLDILVNCASNFLRTPAGEVGERDWDRSLDVNLKGSFFCAQAAARLMRAKAEGRDRRGGEPAGKIVNFADSAAPRPYPNHLPYLVSKAGVITMTQALALELAPDVLVNAIAPGVVLPPETAGEKEIERALRHVPLGRAGAPADIVAAVAFLLEGSDYVTGQVITVDGGRLIAQPERRC